MEKVWYFFVQFMFGNESGGTAETYVVPSTYCFIFKLFLNLIGIFSSLTNNFVFWLGIGKN